MIARARRRLDEAARRRAVRAIGPEMSTQRLAQSDMRVVAKLVAKGRVRWTADGVKLTGKGEPR